MLCEWTSIHDVYQFDSSKYNDKINKRNKNNAIFLQVFVYITLCDHQKLSIAIVLSLQKM